MPNKIVVTTQGQAWDQIAKREYSQETMMGVLLPENVEHMDTLFFSGDVSVRTPDVQPERVKSLPPWERM